MRKVKIIGAAIIAVVALSALASAMASAAEPEFKNFPLKFTSKSGKGTLQIKGGTAIECEKDTNTGEAINTKEVTATIDFLGCSAFKLVKAHSLGDEAGVILTTVKGSLCILEEKVSPGTKLRIGLRLAPTGKVHIEVSTELAVIEGTVIGEVKLINALKLGGFELLLEQGAAAGEQKIKECKGGPKEVLLGQENEKGEFKEAAEVTNDEINWLVKEQEIIG